MTLLTSQSAGGAFDMASSASSGIVLVLHYLAPFVILGCFFSLSIWSILMLQTTDAKVSKHLKKVVVLMMVGACMSMLLEAIINVSSILSNGSSSVSKDANVYALSGVLVWVVMSGSAVRSEYHRWYPYCGAWIIAGVIDATVVASELQRRTVEGPVSWIRIGLKTLRIVLVMALLVQVFLTRSNKDAITDEETTPLLAKDPTTSDAQEASRSSEENAVQNRIDHEAQRRMKERDKKYNHMQDKLREDGNWFAYVRRFWIFWPYLWPTNRPRLLINMAIVGICLVAERVLNLLGPIMLGNLVNDLTAGLGGPAFKALALYILFDWLNSYSGVRGLRAALWVPVESNARACLDKKSYDHIMELSCDFHDEKQDGELFAAMRQGVSITNLLETIVYDVGPLVVDLGIALAYFWILFDAYLVVIAAYTMVIYIWATLFITNYQVNLQRRLNAMYRQKYTYLYDTMSQWRTVVYFNRIPHVEALYAATVSVFNAMWRKVRYVSHGGHGLQNVILDLGSFAAFSFAVYQVVYHGRDLGSFMTLFSYWSRFTSPLQYLSGTHLEVMQDLVDAEELRRLFEMEPSVPDGPDELQADGAEVVFENVAFSYDGKGANIKDFSLKVPSGKTVALIGETGAGKSTLLKLLFRFYDVKGGSIKIDGQDIRNVSLSSLREAVGVVPQEPNLFNDSILANLRFGKLDVTKEEATEACKAAAVHDQIEKFADGYDSIVGERGVKLSGGERQRVAIARTLLKNPKLILLDEATSSVDNETEEKIQAGLAKLCTGRTTIVIAHRLSTIMDADLIIVIKDGAILEQGTPRELLKRKGKYHSLWSKQMGIIDALAKQDEIESYVGASSSSQPASINEAENGSDRESTLNNGRIIISSSDVTNLLPAQSRCGPNFVGSGHTCVKFRPEAPEFIPASQVISNTCSQPLAIASLSFGNAAMNKDEPDEENRHKPTVTNGNQIPKSGLAQGLNNEQSTLPTPQHTPLHIVSHSDGTPRALNETHSNETSRTSL